MQKLPGVLGASGEQHKWSENSAWYQDESRRAGILVCSSGLSISDFLESDVGFIWVKVTGVRVYNCYFSRSTLSRSSRPRYSSLRKASERLIDELGWAKSAESLEDTMRAARRKVVAACDHSMPRRGHGRTGD